MNLSLENLRKRLLFRAGRRGSKEADALIGGCAERHVARLDVEQMARFEAMLDNDDPYVMSWIAGTAEVPAEFDNDILVLLRQFRDDRRNRGRD